ncbi:MAG: VOC family protein, partial [Bacteroidota bacterium]
MKINPHIHFNGNTEAAFKFYRSVIGGEFKRIMRFSDLVSDEFAFPEEELTKIMHIDLTIGQITVLTGSDVPAMFGQVSEEENRSKICLSADSKEEADALFAGL